MECPKVVMFDLDDTLAESFRPLRPEMVTRLAHLLNAVPIAIMTAAGYLRIEQDVVAPLTENSNFARMYLFPNSSTQCYLYERGQWKLEYSLLLPLEDRARIKSALAETIEETGVAGVAGYEPQVLDREAQVAYTFLGLEAPDDVKRAWDPSGERRTKVLLALTRKIPEFDIFIGGRTTIDITRKGVNKAYGVEWLAKKLNLPTAEMLFVGDALYEGGNDSVVIPTGVQTRPVTGPEETLTVIDELLSVCANTN